MPLMKRSVVALLTLVYAITSTGQQRGIIAVPDIPGYETLVCDFHLHTVFSDGLVWPTVRVDEAWYEGLDAIAITDHLEYLPHEEFIRTDHNQPWQLAKQYAANKDVIVIAGTEITKEMPPGHFNALFIKDASAILNDDYEKAIEKAVDQGAFIIWNHPGWVVQQPDTMKWWDEHTSLYDKGWLHGIEVVNSDEYYPEAINWARARELTMMGNSDKHGPFLSGKFTPEDHRSCTFVFATGRSEGAIREALFNNRTAAYIGKNVIGKSSLLEALFLQSVRLKPPNPERQFYYFTNNTDLQFDLLLEDVIYGDWQKKITIHPGHESVFSLHPESTPEDIQVSVLNFLTGSDEVLKLSFSAIKPVQ